MEKGHDIECQPEHESHWKILQNRHEEDHTRFQPKHQVIDKKYEHFDSSGLLLLFSSPKLCRTIFWPTLAQDTNHMNRPKNSAVQQINRQDAEVVTTRVKKLGLLFPRIEQRGMERR